ncbi:MAG: uroporphyrinogen-III synthase [Legionella sp.]|nr:MAG: uroporphyrinogen-III synthase [Legionella sp.]PJD97730.1 MAG: uroporphyrinogen-III synthase [Legionella sp.]
MRTLNGLRILNTRPLEQGLVLSEQIHQAGGIAISCPLIAINSLSNTLLPDLHQLNLAIFISANAVELCCQQLTRQKLIWPEHIHVIAIGQGTANSLAKHHIHVHELPDSPQSEHLLTLLESQSWQQKQVALFKGEGGRPVIEEYLHKQQAKLHVVTLYQRVLPALDRQFLHSLWRDDAVDIILLTSAQAIQHLFLLFDPSEHPWLTSKTGLVLSERLAQIAKAAGFKKIIISHPNQIIDSLFDYKD